MKTTLIEIDGDNEARGHNGWFKVARMEVLSGLPFPGPGMVEIRAWSKREADCAPVILILPAQAVLNLAHEITKAGISAAFASPQGGKA